MSRRYRDSGRHWDRPRDRDEEMDRYRGKERHRDRDQERNKDRDHLSRDRYAERNSWDGRDRGRVDHYDRHVGSRDHELREDNEREKNKPRGHRSRPYSKDHSLGKSRSRSRSNSPSRSRSCSHSPSKGKRASGFDMAPVGADVLAASTVQGLLPDIAQPVPGLFPNLFPFGTSQFGGLPLVPPQAMTQQATRHARRVYVGGLPPLANEQAIATYFSRVMAAIGGSTAGPGDSVVNVYINHEKKFAFVEMRTVEEASNAMALDGITFEGVAVRVRRPTDYNPSLAAQLGPSQPSLHLNLAAVGLIPGATCGAEGPDRIFIGGLPYYFTESQIRELLESFGPLRGFDLVKDRDTGNSKGYGFCVYQDAAVTDIACAALNGLKMGDKTLTVRRATVSTGQTRPDQDIILQQAQQHIALQKLVLQAGGAALPAIGAIPMNFPTETPTKVVRLSQALSSDELHDDNEYNEILEDMREEGGKFGELVNVVIPRPSPSGDHSGGVGKVFLEYADTVASAKAKAALNGRKFLDNMVIASFCAEDKFYNGELE